MGAKDNAAVIQLFDLLESRYAMRVIWALSDGHPQTFRLLQDSVGGVTPNTLNTRLKQLRAARLVDHAREGYRLTTQGADLARRMSDVQGFASKWSQQQARSVAPLNPVLNGASTQQPAA
jgi:DNA-binding HxlR family transcriptional regulator